MLKFLLLLLFVPCVAMAGDAPSRADEYQDLQAKLVILKKKVEIAEQEAKLRNPAGSSSAPTNTLPGAYQGGLPGQANAPAVPLPPQYESGFTLREISSFNGHYKARIRVNGHEVAVVEGDVVDGGWKVVSISDSEVVLASGKKVIVLRA